MKEAQKATAQRALKTECNKNKIRDSHVALFFQVSQLECSKEKYLISFTDENVFNIATKQF